MRVSLITISLFCSFWLSAQKEVVLKNKYLGTYKGVIPSYEFDTGSDLATVSASQIEIKISKETIAVNIGNQSLSGTYKVMFEAKKYYLLDAKMEGQLATERIMVYKFGRTLIRDGMYPQPVTELKKTR